MGLLLFGPSKKEIWKQLASEIKDNEGLCKNHLPSDVDELYFSVTG